MPAKTRIPIDQGWIAEQQREKALNLAVAELGLDLRTVNGLEESGVLYVRELVKTTPAELGRIPNFGDKSVEQIIRVLKTHALSLAQPSNH